MTIWAISGCSNGLGRCWTTSIIEDRGDTVIGITRSANGARELVEEFGDRFVPVICDVTDSDALARKLVEAAERTGAPSRVVTAAGYAQFGTLEDLPNEAINAQFRTNVEGTLNVVRPLLPLLRKTQDPRILVVSSMSGVVSWPLLGAYQQICSRGDRRHAAPGTARGRHQGRLHRTRPPQDRVGFDLCQALRDRPGLRRRGAQTRSVLRLSHQGRGGESPVFLGDVRCSFDAPAHRDIERFRRSRDRRRPFPYQRLETVSCWLND